VQNPAGPASFVGVDVPQLRDNSGDAVDAASHGTARVALEDVDAVEQRG
jgi:hypothetical protein